MLLASLSSSFGELLMYIALIASGLILLAQRFFRRNPEAKEPAKAIASKIVSPLGNILGTAIKKKLGG